MEFINSQGNEEDLEMESIALSSPTMQEHAANALNNDCKGNNPHEQNKTITMKLRNILVTIREKFNAMTKFVEDQWLKRYGPATDLDRTRAYQGWPGNNVFFFHGRLVCGPDPKGLLLTTVSIVLSSWIFAMYTGDEDDLPLNSSLILTLSLVLTMIVLVNLFLVSAIDPGIIPRNDQTPLEEIGTSDGGSRRKKVTINGVEVKLKYCRICKIFRPPRSCHCAICNNCVEKFDHHCPWIGHCIALILPDICDLSPEFLYLHIFILFLENPKRLSKIGTGLLGMLLNSPETLALLLFSFAAIWFLGGLAIFHAYLIAINQTAYENFRQCYVGSGNPFDRGILCNIKEALFSPLQPSKVDFHAEITPTGHSNAEMEG
ncbi:hypothetical protein GH714_016994 [Hevea brasiliensis]|uniref:S-acyltransferase n=1 Tax=Hevea brasiliensis TaxID=3981 RepID=A0A6A6KVK6_HEVBR|nr:hypothetical protein GH714_016994 [Hevea brasiliensis]